MTEWTEATVAESLRGVCACGARIGVCGDARTAADMNLAEILFINLRDYPHAGQVSYAQ